MNWKLKIQKYMCIYRYTYIWKLNMQHRMHFTSTGEKDELLCF